MTAGRDDHDLRAVFQHLLGAQSRALVHLDVRQLVELDLTVVDDPLPLSQPTGAAAEQILLAVGMPHLRDPVDGAADLLVRLDQMHGRHLALAEHHRALHPGRPGADHEHALLTIGCGMEVLGVPAAAGLLAGGRVLGADHRRAADLPARDALVATDALADVVEPSLPDLLWPEWIGDGGPGGR